MERITEKYDINYKHKNMSKIELDDMYSCLKDRNLLAQTFWKLGQLEDIEDELGIDLITLFKILKANECYSKEDGECRIVGIDMNGAILMPKKFPFGECEFTVPFTEFGKTWALTREGLKQC